MHECWLRQGPSAPHLACPAGWLTSKTNQLLASLWCLETVHGLPVPPGTLPVLVQEKSGPWSIVGSSAPLRWAKPVPLRDTLGQENQVESTLFTLPGGYLFPPPPARARLLPQAAHSPADGPLIAFQSEANALKMLSS